MEFETDPEIDLDFELNEDGEAIPFQILKLGVKEATTPGITLMRFRFARTIAEIADPDPPAIELMMNFRQLCKLRDRLIASAVRHQQATEPPETTAH